MTITRESLRTAVVLAKFFLLTVFISVVIRIGLSLVLPHTGPPSVNWWGPSLSRAKADSALRLVSQIMLQAPTDWRAAAFLLERRFPDDYGKRSLAVLRRTESGDTSFRSLSFKTVYQSHHLWTQPHCLGKRIDAAVTEHRHCSCLHDAAEY